MYRYLHNGVAIFPCRVDVSIIGREHSLGSRGSDRKKYSQGRASDNEEVCGSRQIGPHSETIKRDKKSEGFKGRGGKKSDYPISIPAPHHDHKGKEKPCEKQIRESL